MRVLGYNLGRALADLDQARDLLNDVGELASGVLRVAADVVNGQTVTIGTDVFEVDIINTDLTLNTVGIVADTTDNTIVTLEVGATTFAVGDLIRVENEILKVLGVRVQGTVSVAAVLLCARAASGTTEASHADDSDVYVSDSPPTATIPVGLVATLTPAVFSAALPTEVNRALGSGVLFPASDQAGLVQATKVSDNLVLVSAKVPGVLALATTETLLGSGNAWDRATLGDGSAPAARHVAIVARAIEAEEITANLIVVPFSFDPLFVDVEIVVTSTSARKQHDGDAIITAASGDDPAYVSVNNDGSVNFATGDSIRLVAIG